jgi:transcriptional regulator with XRE-family HTH domain
VARHEEPDPLGGFIRMQRELSDLSVRQLADLANVSNAYLSQVERGLYQPSAQVLKNLAEALELSAREFYERAGLLDEEPGRATGVEEAIRLDPDLTAEQKETMIRVYHGLTDRT